MSDVENRQLDLAAAIAALRKDYSHLVPRIRTLEHDVTSTCPKVSLRLHYPSLRDGRATLGDLIDAIALHITHFCLPRSDLTKVYAQSQTVAPDEYHRKITELNAKAADLFIRAQAASNRSGEAGELLLYLLTEWILEAPQIVAKMSLKTNRDMPVHGSDGIHIKYLPSTGKLLLFTGEAKFHGRVSDALSDAITSIAKSLEHDKMSREIELVKRDLDFSGLPSDAREALLSYLDPFDNLSNDRSDVITCLIGFNFEGYARLSQSTGDPETIFRKAALEEMSKLSLAFSTKLERAGLRDRAIELFLLPLPSVDELRKTFSKRLGIVI